MYWISIWYVPSMTFIPRELHSLGLASIFHKSGIFPISRSTPSSVLHPLQNHILMCHLNWKTAGIPGLSGFSVDRAVDWKLSETVLLTVDHPETDLTYKRTSLTSSPLSLLSQSARHSTVQRTLTALRYESFWNRSGSKWTLKSEVEFSESALGPVDSVWKVHPVDLF